MSDPLIILQNMQKSRREEKEQYGHFWELCNESALREAILTLALPYRLDTASIGHALSQEDFGLKLGAELEERKNRDRITGNATEGDSGLTVIYKDNSFLNMLEKNEWLPQVEREYRIQAHGRDFVVKYKWGVERRLGDDYINSTTAYNVFLGDLSLAYDTRKSYRSYINIAFSKYAVVEELEKQKIRAVDFLASSKPIPLNLYAIASLYDYLEQRCIESQSEGAYRNLLAVRLLLYMPLPCEELKKIRRSHFHVDTPETCCLSFNNRSFPVPMAFVALCEAVVPAKEPLLHCSHNRLCEIIRCSKESAKIQESDLTGKYIQSALGVILANEEKRYGISRSRLLR